MVHLIIGGNWDPEIQEIDGNKMNQERAVF